MGWETGVSLGANAFSGFNTTQQGLASADAQAQQADQVAQNEADATSRKIGSLQTSFLQSGIVLNNLGGTNAVLQQAATQGRLNIQRSVSNANANIANTMNTARTKSLEAIGQSLTQNQAGLKSGWKDLYGGSDLQGAIGPSFLDPTP